MIVSAIVSVFVKTTWSDAVFGIGIGIILLFSPDTIIEKLKDFIK